MRQQDVEHYDASSPRRHHLMPLVEKRVLLRHHPARLHEGASTSILSCQAVDYSRDNRSNSLVKKTFLMRADAAHANGRR